MSSVGPTQRPVSKAVSTLRSATALQNRAAPPNLVCDFTRDPQTNMGRGWNPALHQCIGCDPHSPQPPRERGGSPGRDKSAAPELGLPGGTTTALPLVVVKHRKSSSSSLPGLDTAALTRHRFVPPLQRFNFSTLQPPPPGSLRIATLPDAADLAPGLGVGLGTRLGLGFTLTKRRLARG